MKYKMNIIYRYAVCCLIFSGSLYGQKIAVVTSDTRKLNSNLQDAHRSAGGKGTLSPIGSTIKIVALEGNSKPVTLRVGEAASCEFFDKSKKILVASNSENGRNIKVSGYVTVTGEKLFEFEILDMRKFVILPNWNNGLRFNFSDLVGFENSGKFALVGESRSDEILKKPRKHQGTWAKIVVFNSKEMLIERNLEVPIFSAMLSKLDENKRGIVGVIGVDSMIAPIQLQLNEFSAGNELELKQMVKSDLIAYATNFEDKLVFLKNGSQLLEVDSSAQKLTEYFSNFNKAKSRIPINDVAIIPLPNERKFVKVVQGLGDEEHWQGRERKKLTFIELYQKGKSDSLKKISLNYSVVDIKLNKEGDKLIVLSQEKPQIQIYSTKDFTKVATIDHVLDNPTDLVAW